MKNIILFCLILTVIYACQNNSVERNSETSLNFLIKEQIKKYHFSVNYTNKDSYELNNEQIDSLIRCITTFEYDSIFNKLPLNVFSNSFVLTIEASVNKEISPDIAMKRANTIGENIADVLGRDINKVHVFKTIKSLKYREKHDLEIKVNRLMY
jgi:hypothetical protein